MDLGERLLPFLCCGKEPNLSSLPAPLTTAYRDPTGRFVSRRSVYNRRGLLAGAALAAGAAGQYLLMPRRDQRVVPYVRRANGNGGQKRARFSGYDKNARTGGYLGIETKFTDFGLAETTVLTTVTGSEMDPVAPTLCLNAMVQGDGETQRDGRRALITSLHLRGTVELLATDDNGVITRGSIVRVVVLQDMQTNGAQFNAEDVFSTFGTASHAFRNLEFTKRFKILKDAVFVLNPASAAAGTAVTVDTGPVKRYFAWNFNKLNMPVNHNGTTAQVSTITDNSLHIMAFCDAGLVKLSYNSRSRFQS